MTIEKQGLNDVIDALTVDSTTLSQSDVNYLTNYLLSNGNMTGSPRDLIQIRRGNKENLPLLAQGEPAITLDTGELFIGGVDGNIVLPTKTTLQKERFAPDYDPVYDLAYADLAATFYHNINANIPNNKSWYVNNVSGINNSQGNGYLRAYSWELEAGPLATGDSVRGAIGLVKSSGAATVKSVHGTAQGLIGHTGSLVGVVGQVQPAPTSGESWSFQATCGDGTDAAMVINTINPTDIIKYGIRVKNNSKIANHLILFDDLSRTANIITVRDATAANNALTEIFKIAPDGSIYMKGQQTVLEFNNINRTWQFQAINAGDYFRLTAGGSGEVLKLAANGGMQMLGTAGGLMGAGTLNTKMLFVDGVKVVGTQQPLVQDSTNATTPEYRDKINAIFAILRTHGLMASA